MMPSAGLRGLSKSLGFGQCLRVPADKVAGVAKKQEAVLWKVAVERVSKGGFGFGAVQSAGGGVPLAPGADETGLEPGDHIFVGF